MRLLRICKICAIAALFCFLLVRSASNSASTAPATEGLNKPAVLLSAPLSKPAESWLLPGLLDSARTAPSAASPLTPAAASGTVGLDESSLNMTQDLAHPEALALPALPPAPTPSAVTDSTTSSSASKPANPDSIRKKKENYREVWAIVTAYCPCSRCCGRSAQGVTSQGGSAWKPGIAADPQAIDYGTKVYVPGYGTFRVDDTGSAMRHSWRRDGRLHVDIRMTYHWQARDWGHRSMKIRVYDN